MSKSLSPKGLPKPPFWEILKTLFSVNRNRCLAQPAPAHFAPVNIRRLLKVCSEDFNQFQIFQELSSINLVDEHILPQVQFYVNPIECAGMEF
jgi:hypothetical protein